MPRYFFHVRDGHEIPDRDGVELPDIGAVREEAITTSGELLRGTRGDAAFWAGHDWTMTVVDEAGERVLELRFSGTQYP